MKKMLSIALATVAVASAFAQEGEIKYRKSEVSLVGGLNNYGLAAGLNNSEWGYFPTDYSENPLHIGLEYSYSFTPLIAVNAGFSYNVVAGKNDVEKFRSESYLPSAGISIRPFNHAPNFLKGFALNGGLGWSMYNAERRFTSDNAMHVPPRDAGALAMTGAVSYRVRLNHALALQLRYSSVTVMNDEFDAWDYGNGTDVYSGFSAGLTYVVGAKKGDKSLAEATVKELRAGELDKLATKEEVGVVKKDVANLSGRVLKLESTLPELVKRKDVDTIVKEVIRNEWVTKNVGGKTIKALSTVYYSFDKDEIESKYLTYVEEFMQSYKAGDAIILIGYADLVGSNEYNKNLSRNRAEEVKNLLITKYGVPAEVITVNVGEVKVDNKAQQFLNRRVDLFLY
jgi:outer membrane protein OmpA-like peptidoglycan-associated protein